MEQTDADIPRYYGAGGGSAIDAFKAFGHYVEDPRSIMESYDSFAWMSDPFGETGVALPSDVYKTATADNTTDRVINSAGVIGDLANMYGSGPLGDAASVVKGGAELKKAGDEWERGIDNDNDLMMMQALNDTLYGASDVASAVPEDHVKYGAKALKVGMDVGNKIAPLVFGDNKTSSDVLLDDGSYAPSTGNNTIDWIAGTGAYNESRFEDHRASNHQSVADTAHNAIDAGLDASNANAAAVEANASPEEAARIHANRKALFENGMGPDPDA